MSDGILLHLCVSAKRGIAKHEVPLALLRASYGVENDAHAGDWHRQVSLLARADIDSMRAKGLDLSPGTFGENLVIDGIEIDQLGVGSQLRIGPVLLEMTQVGKVCHTRCVIYYTAGDCIMPRTGLFARVLEGGALHPGLSVEVLRRVPRSAIQAAVVTASDRCAAGSTVDTSGPAVAKLLRDRLGAHIAWSKIVPDDARLIAELLKDLCDRRVDLIITTGGTGLSARDVTPEATRAVIDRELPGLAETMRAASAGQTPYAPLSRAIAGVRNETLIINLPGSERGATENLSAILPALPHAVKILRGEPSHPENDRGRLVSITQAGRMEALSPLSMGKIK
jgi:molybdenum cofactor synthesis domain-containing protein